jgi:hypothetical protein
MNEQANNFDMVGSVHHHRVWVAIHKIFLRSISINLDSKKAVIFAIVNTVLVRQIFELS